MESPARSQFACKLLGGCCVVIASLATLAPDSASAETRGYAISLIHTATYADKDNCPQGGNGGLVDIKQRILMREGYTKDQAIRIIAANGVDEQGRKVDLRKRGQMDGKAVDVLNFPTSVPDPKLETAHGRFAFGFNLDGKVQPGSFEDPETGEKGVDNQMWRVLGCYEVYAVRRPVIPYNESIAWDTAMDSMPAWLLSISGPDLSKDGDVTVTFDRSLNITMRDARGSVLRSSSYSIDADPRSHSVFKGHIRNQVLTIEPGDFSMQGESQFYAVLRFTHTQLRLKMNPDGSLGGLIGGYQPWMDYYYYLAIRGEETGQVDMPAVYYAMKRLADADPDPATGQNRAISAAYYIEAAPAFLTNAGRQTVATAYAPSTAPVQQQAPIQQEAAVRQ
ncbi:MAG TPA: hypothetical protein VGN07_16980 [Steroidobacteraceae bacterium]